LDERVASICDAQPRNSFTQVFSDGRPAPIFVSGIGDSVSVTIWEAAVGGLFSERTCRPMGTGAWGALALRGLKPFPTMWPFCNKWPKKASHCHCLSGSFRVLVQSIPRLG